ncbi:Protein MurJ homolog [uncultured Alphaproteobacteria bacterium]|uniref:Probable lipid II flippase MurJ n=1 Tax=uncultured Alphaproteobacteria bacterium TaxID=91750 RepID=A0A212KAH8_9PROT|nr:Protein MurJ homolog [uncultured Alphaproteobacteria bacterium]
MSLYRAVATVGGFTLISRVTGFVRDVLLARMLGAGTEADAFFVAFRFPNLFRHLFAEGAFSAAFVPLFARKLEGEGKAAAKRFSDVVFAGLALVLLAMVLAMELIMPWAITVFAPGFLETPGKIELTGELARIAFPYLFFIALVSLLSGIQNSLGRFAAAAAAPILLNLCLIVAAIGYGRAWSGTGPGAVLAWAVSISGLVQFLWLWHHNRKSGMGPGLALPRWNADVARLGGRILPGVVGMGVYQINLLVDTVIASLVSEGAVSWLYYADRVNQLPLGVVGIAIGTALLPMLSRQIKGGREDVAAHTQNRGLEFALFLTLPAAAALAALALPIVATLFERGRFAAEDTAATAAALTAFACGLPAHVLVKCLVPGFFAREDTATPVRIAAVCLVSNVVLNLALMKPLGHVGIATATAVSAWINAGLLGYVLARRGHFRVDSRLLDRAPRILAAALAMAGALAAGQVYADALPGFAALPAWGRLLVWVGFGAAVYAGFARAFRAATVAELRQALRRG